MPSKPSNLPAVLRDLDAIIARWKTGQDSQASLAREYHVGIPVLTDAMKTRIPEPIFRRIARHHKATSKGDKLLTVRVWRQGWKRKKGHRRQPQRRFIKVRNDPDGGVNNWMPLSRWLWEREYGPVPAGCYVGFKDGNQMHDSLDNLHLLSRVETARVAVAKCDGAKRGARISRTKKMQAEIRKRIEAARRQKREAIADAYFEGQDEWDEEAA